MEAGEEEQNTSLALPITFLFEKAVSKRGK